MPDSTIITDQTPKEKPVVITNENSKKTMFKFSFVNPKILATMTVLLLLIGGVGTGVYLTQQPQKTSTEASIPESIELTFKPDKIQTNASSEFRVDVFVSAGKNQITSLDLSFKYDPSVLKLKSITPGEFLPKILIPPDINSGTASISLGTDGNSGVSGSGIIAGLVFEATSPSLTIITFDPQKTIIKVLNRTAENANDTLGSVQINISSVSSPAPVSSQIPKVKENSDLNGDGVVNAIDRSLYQQKSKQ